MTWEQNAEASQLDSLTNQDISDIRMLYRSCKYKVKQIKIFCDLYPEVTRTEIMRCLGAPAVQNEIIPNKIKVTKKSKE